MMEQGSYFQLLLGFLVAQNKNNTVMELAAWLPAYHALDPLT